MADESPKCGKCGATSNVYNMTKLHECRKCETVICRECIPDDCITGKFIFKKLLCPDCKGKLHDCEIQI